MTTEPPEPDDDPQLLELALAITDSQAVDWESARQSAGVLEETLERLHEIERVARSVEPDEAEDATRAPVFTWGPLRALAKLGEGAFGEVWCAWDPALQRDVALKLRRDGAPGAQARWLDEARRLARVRHANVLTVHGADVHDGRAGLWSDLVRGRTLEQLLFDVGPLSAEEAAAIGAHLCAALAAVHAAGLVHGDLKTRNVMREGRPDGAAGAGRIVLMDFGAAGDSLGPARSPSAATPLYAAPELLTGARPSAASDLYALGVLLYRLVTARYPIEAANLAELRTLAAAGEFVPLRQRRADLPAPFVRAVERALALSPAQRFASAAEFERELAGPAAAAPVARRGLLRALAPLFAGAAIASALWFAVPRWTTWFQPTFHVRTARPAAALTSEIVLSSDDRLVDAAAASCALGDIDGDGRPEVAIASAGGHGGTGVVELFSLEADGRLTPRGEWDGLAAGDQFGAAIVAGDFNGDGVPDVAVAATGSSAGAPHAGAVSLYFGGHGLPMRPGLVLAGLRSLQDFGYAMSLAGDVNGDGIRDLVVGAPADDEAGSGTGRAYVYFGGRTPHDKPDLVLASSHAHSQYGISVEDGADIDGDGIADIAVGANWDSEEAPYAGAVFVYRGGRHMETSVDRVLHGPGEDAWFGTRILGTADFDGDGYRDLAISAMRGGGLIPGAGSVRIFRCGPGLAGKPWRILRDSDLNGEFGNRLAECDLNGDGHPDLAVCSHWHSGAGAGLGAVAVYYGGPRMDEVCDARVLGRQVGENFGYSIAALPPRAADGCGGLLVGSAHHEESGVPKGGRVTRLDFHRYALLRPHPGDTAPAAGTPLAWNGAEPATIRCSSDGGRTWRVVAAEAGGREENLLAVKPPAGATRVRWRITPRDPRVPGAVETAELPVVR